MIHRSLFYLKLTFARSVSFIVVYVTSSNNKKEALCPMNNYVFIIITGQMIYMDNWRMMMYLGTPVMPDLTSLITTGLYINDLSMHDFSR